MNEETFQDIWTECLGFNIEQKPEEYKQLLSLLDERKSKRYALEIGSNYGGTTAGFCRLFEKVITIDIKHHPNFDKLKEKYPSYKYIISDSKASETIDYIRQMGIKFDFIFIDGDHSYEGVKSDYDKYKQFLAHDGHMAFHDIIYTAENVQDNTRVDKLWNEIASYYPERHEFVSLVKNHPYSTDNFFYKIICNRAYASWGGIGVLKNNPVALFSHNYLHSHWFYIVESQLKKIKDSGLYARADKMFYGVQPSTEYSYHQFLEIIRKYDTDKKIEVVRYDRNLYEYQTLIHLQNYCADNPNATVLYYHAKGSSRPYDKYIESWRECLEYFNIEQWKRCYEKVRIEGHDTCGALYVSKFEYDGKIFRDYYSGNFWWASANYINKLDNLTTRMLEKNMERNEAEFWIGKKPHIWANLYEEYVPAWYTHYFDPNVYRHDRQ